MCRVSWQPKQREREREKEGKKERGGRCRKRKRVERTEGASERAKGFYCINILHTSEESY